MPEKFWQVPFPCLACNVNPLKQRAAIAEDCQGRVFEPSVVAQTHAACSFAEAFIFIFIVFVLFEPFLNKVVILLYPTGDD